MKEMVRYFGLVGLALIVLSFLVKLISADWSLLNWIFLVLGVMLILIFTWINRKKVGQFLKTRSFRYSSNIFFMMCHRSRLSVYFFILLPRTCFRV